MTKSELEGNFGSDEKILKLDCDDGCMILSIY